MTHGGDVQIAKALVFVINARREPGDFNVQRRDVLLWVLMIHFHHQRGLGAGPITHGPAFQDHAFGLDRLHELYERIRPEHADVLFHVPGPG